MTLTKANTLSKIVKGGAVWVPPVYDEGYHVRVVPVTNEYETLVREETRSALPAGWSVNSYSNLDVSMVGQPRPFVVTTGVSPGTRMVGNTREVWSAVSAFYGIWSYAVKVYQRVTENLGTTTVREYYRTLVSAGYWLQQEEPPSWAAGAYSVGRGLAPWEMSFRSPHAPQGTVFGVAEAGVPQRGFDLRQNIKLGVYLRGDDAFLWNPAGLPVRELTPLLPRTNATVYKLVSDGVNVTLYQSDVPALTVPDPTSGKESFVRAALYGKDDEVTQPTFTFSPNTGEGRVDLSMFMRAGSSDYESGARINLTLAVDAHSLESTFRLPLSLWIDAGDYGAEGAFDLGLSIITSAYGVNGGTGQTSLSLSLSLNAAAYEDGSGYGFVALTPVLEMLGGDGADGALQTLAVHTSIDSETTAGQIAYQPAGMHTFIDATVFQHAATGARMGVHTSFATSRLLEQGIAARLGLSSTMQAVRLLAANIVTGVKAGAEIGYMVVLEQAIGEALELGTSLTAGIDLSALVDEVLQIGDGILPSATLSALMHTLIGVTAVHDFGAPSAVWSVTDTGSGAEGSTAYANYPFNSFACIDGEYFGASESGLYVLEGDTDEGQDIDAFADMGLRNFDSRALKGLVNAYVSTNASTPLRLHISVGEQTYVYDARGASAQHMTQRFDLGRGLRAHFFGLKLSNSGGAAFETDRIEFIANESKRRI